MTDGMGGSLPLAMDRRPGLLVICDRGDADFHAAMAEAADLRLQAVVPFERTMEQVDRAAALDVILLRCAEISPLLVDILERLDDRVRDGGASLIVQCAPAVLDMAYALCRAPGTRLLCDGNWDDLAAALIVARRARHCEALVCETDPEKEQLRRLSEDVGRLTRTIESLISARNLGASAPQVSDRSGDYIGMPAIQPLDAVREPSPLVGLRGAQVREMLRARRMRADFLPGDLFADPAWDMLLDLLAARLDGERVSVSSLCIAAAVPPTTALRWIRSLTEQGLVERHADPLDGRRIFIQLADHAAEALGRWFHASRRLLVAAVG